MCGIAGYLTENYTGLDASNILSEMGGAINHRGPDDVGYYSSHPVHLVHTRLSILDLSENGKQPMSSTNGKYTIVFNGEIYNYKDLVEQLSAKGIRLSGTSDTEALLEYITLVGLKDTLAKIRGMFAFALYENGTNNLHLVRDRTGEKPLYYYADENKLIFGSELKTLLAWPEKKFGIDKGARSNFFKYGFVSSGVSILQGVSKLKSGHHLEVKIDNGKISTKLNKYWDVLNSRTTSEKDISLRQASNEISLLLDQAVKEQMVSDVPLGAFLSGGVDSSLVVAKMAENSTSKIETFSIGFDDEEYDESSYAEAVAKHLGTSHNTLQVSETDLLDVIEKLPIIYDEPISDMSQIPTYLVSKFARKKVTVALTGDGGDELFCGYDRYSWSSQISCCSRFIPAFFNPTIKKALSNIPVAYYEKLKYLIPNGRYTPEIGIKIQKFLKGVVSNNDFELYESLLDKFGKDLPNNMRNARLHNPFGLQDTSLSHLNIKEKMMLYDFHNYLTDNVLCKVDRAGMSASIETRAPFLDKRIIEKAFSIPIETKLAGGKSKAILRDILYQYVPKNLIERPKMGFGVPMSAWLKGPLKSWAEYILFEVGCSDFISHSAIKSIWEEHLSGKQNNQYQLWALISYIRWFETYKERLVSD